MGNIRGKVTMVFTKDFSAKTFSLAMQLMDDFFIENPHYRMLDHEILSNCTVRVEYIVLQ